MKFSLYLFSVCALSFILIYSCSTEEEESVTPVVQTPEQESVEYTLAVSAAVLFCRTRALVNKALLPGFRRAALTESAVLSRSIFGPASPFLRVFLYCLPFFGFFGGFLLGFFEALGP